MQGVFLLPPSHTMIAPASNSIMVHYSFDFVQQVHYPSNPLHPGPIYFLTPRKAAIFGVCSEVIHWQVNFVIDEASDTGNRSCQHAGLCFSHYGLGEATTSLHADNCCGQNKYYGAVPDVVSPHWSAPLHWVALFEHLPHPSSPSMPVLASSRESFAMSACWTTWLV